MADACRGRRVNDVCLAHHRDTPPVDEQCCRGRSPGSRVVATVRPSRSHMASVTLVGQRLAAYSCGGSAGIRPASLLAPDQAGPGEPKQKSNICKWIPSSTGAFAGRSLSQFAAFHNEPLSRFKESLTLHREYPHIWVSRSVRSQYLVAKREAGESRLGRENPALPPQL